MSKTILITGSTDGIGLETAKLLVGSGHTVLIHGRSEAKLAAVKTTLAGISGAGTIESYQADLSQVSQVVALADEIAAIHSRLDVLINNAGVFKTPNALTENDIDIRFIVNVLAPYVLTSKLLPIMPPEGRVVNLSSAAQATVNLGALAGKIRLDDNQAYAQSKLALTMWSFHLAQALKDSGPAIIAVNPASMLASKMVKDAYGVQGGDLAIGANILVRAALSEEFADASGKYYDNDQRRFASPHGDALSARKNEQLVQAVESLLKQLRG